MTYWVYMLASRKYGTLYVGVTNSLERRILEHIEGRVCGFTSRYRVKRLVWHRAYGEVTEAIHFEKQLKRWRRDWKIDLIEQDNPDWDDLYRQSIAPLPATLAVLGPVFRCAKTGMTPELAGR